MADQNSSNNMNSAGGRRNPADNLTREDRIRGGERSAAMQNRDATGQFAGRKNAEANRGQSNAGRSGNIGVNNAGGGAGRNAGNSGGNR